MADDIPSTIRDRFKILRDQRVAALETAENMLEELLRLNAAYSALTGSPLDSSIESDHHSRATVNSNASDGAPPRVQKSYRATLSADEIRRALHEVLYFGPLDMNDIQVRMAEIARHQGKSRKGLHLVIPRELRNAEDFERTDNGGFRLRVREKGTEALIDRVRTILGELGPLTEPLLRQRISSLHPAGEGKLETALSKALLDGPFEFNGANWQLKN